MIRQDRSVDYDLRRLGTREFEHLSQALTLKVLGARVGIFGDGPDGGREATYTGRLTWREGDTSEDWDGYTVVQAKFLQNTTDTSTDQRWFLGQLRAELKHWDNPSARRRQRGTSPDYLLLVTNIRLSSTEGGGIEAVGDLFQEYASKLGLKGWRVWHYSQICRLLDDAADIRKAYAGLITPGDVLSQLAQTLQGSVVDLGRTLRTHAVKDLLNERWVRLGQAGQANNDKLSLEQVAIDLPAQIQSGETTQTVSTIVHIIKHGDQVLRPSVIDKGIAPRFVLIGGPGQGKTTLGQLLAQTYRVGLLEQDAVHRNREAENVLAATRRSLDDLGIPRPDNLRWPIRVDLAEYGDAVSGGSDISLFRWLAQRIQDRATVEITAGQLHTWLGAWPWLLILDGLDEVASPAAREQLMKQLTDFFIDADEQNADLLAVITTRPQGYGNEFSGPDYTAVELQPLNAQQAMNYATRLAQVRHHDDDEVRHQTLKRVSEAAVQPLTARLMRTPLQVTIMSLLLERRPRPPQDRHGLFEAYYETIYAREADKPGPLAAVLNEHRSHINALHEQVGLQLQVLAEAAGDADASLPREALKAMALARLHAEGFEPSHAERVVGELIRASTDRLVLVVAKGRDEVGFEVRSLQEFTAARALISGPDELVLQRLRLIAPTVHWRNTWLLAVSRIFSTKEHLRAAVVSSLREIDNDDMLSVVIPTGPELALQLLDDNLAVSSPGHRKMLLMHGLEILRYPPAIAATRTPTLLLHELSFDPNLRHLITHALEEALNGPAGQRATVWLLLNSMQNFTGELAAKARQLRTRTIFDAQQSLAVQSWIAIMSGGHKEFPKPPPGSKPQSLSNLIEPYLKTVELPKESFDLVEQLLVNLRKIEIVSLPPDHQVYTVAHGAALHIFIAIQEGRFPTPVVDALAGALLEIPAEAWVASALLRFLISARRERYSMGQTLLPVPTSSL